MHIDLHVFCCGTSQSLADQEEESWAENPNSLVRVLFISDASTEIQAHDCASINAFITQCGINTDIQSNQNSQKSSLNRTYKIGFAGCDVEYPKIGIATGAFAFGVQEQSDIVFNLVSKLLENGHRVRLTLFGFSRGAITILMIAKKLQYHIIHHLRIALPHIEDDLLMHFVLCDPVPGNFVTTVQFGLPTVSDDLLDMSMVSTLKSVTILFARQDGKTFAFTPLIPRWPAQLRSRVHYYLLPGDHGGAFLSPWRRKFRQRFSGDQCDRPNPFLINNLANVKYYHNILQQYTGKYLESIYGSALTCLIILDKLEDLGFDFSHSGHLISGGEKLLLDLWRTADIRDKVQFEAAKQKRLIRQYAIYEKLREHWRVISTDAHTRVTHSLGGFKFITNPSVLSHDASINTHHLDLNNLFGDLVKAQKPRMPENLLLKII